MALQNNNLITWSDLTSTFLNSLVSACCNVDGYSSDVPAKLRAGQARVQVHSTRVGDHDDWQDVAWFADTTNLISIVNRNGTDSVTTDWNNFLTAANITSRMNKIVAAKDLELAVADFMQFLSYHVKPICSMRKIYQEVETPYLYKANQYVSVGSNPTPAYVIGGSSVPEQQVMADSDVANILSNGFNIAQLMEKYNRTNPKIPTCYLS